MAILKKTGGWLVAGAFLISCGGDQISQAPSRSGEVGGPQQALSGAFVPVCERTEAVKMALMVATGKQDCAAVGVQELQALKGLEISFAKQVSLLEKRLESEDKEHKKKEIQVTLDTFKRSSARLTSLKEGDFSGLSGLKTLDLSDNFLEALLDGVFAPMTQLEILDLSNNLIMKPLTSKTFFGLSLLRVLNLSGNGKTGRAVAKDAPDGLVLAAGCFSPLGNLRELNLSGCRLEQKKKDEPEDVPPGSLNGLSRLETIHLSDNEIKKFPRGLFQPLTSLKTAYMKNNPLDSAEQRRIQREELPNTMIYFR